MRRPIFSLRSLALLSIAGFVAPACLAATAVVATPASCPVELSAVQRGAGVLVATGPQLPRDTSKPQQAIDLSMKNSRLQRIIGADLEVHGTSGAARVMPAHAASLTTEPTSDAVRNVHMVSSVPADQLRTHTVEVNGLTSVQWISVIELRYADGSVWHAGRGRVCAVTPSGMMMVATK